MSDPETPLVAVVMGSTSDWDTMRFADATLEALEVPRACMVVSAHRTPDRLRSFALGAEAAGHRVIVAGAGGAAHLPGMLAAYTHLPVFGVPVTSRALSGLDSLLSIVQMPKGVPVGTLAIGEAGAVNAALLAAAVLALADPDLRERLVAYRARQTSTVEASELPTPAFRVP
jgi:5-(carboxyamino)imidazole ribonucleotide mutase